MNEIKDNTELLNHFRVGFKRLTKTRYIDGFDEMIMYLKTHFNFSEAAMIALAKATHNIDHMYLIINNRPYIIYD